LKLADRAKLLAGSFKSLARRCSYFRPKCALFQGGIDWHGPYPRKSRRGNLDSSKWDRQAWFWFIHSQLPPCLCAVGIFLLIEPPELLIELPQQLGNPAG
jgi:hypothetical protein